MIVGSCSIDVPWRMVVTVLVVMAGFRWLIEWLCCEGPERERAMRRLIGLVLGYASIHMFVW